MRQQVVKFSKEQFDIFNQNLLLSVSEENDQFIHDYRVAAKRIQTLAKLLKRFPSTGKILGYLDKSGIKESFKSGGKSRETSINISLLLESGKRFRYDFRAFHKFLKDKKIQADKKLRKTWSHFPHDAYFKFEYEMLHVFNKVPFARLGKEYNLFMISRVNRIRELIASGDLTGNLHRARKVIKDIKYGLEMSGKTEGSFNNLTLNHPEITLLEDLIGLWHDWFVFYDEMRRFTMERKNEGYRFNKIYRDLELETGKLTRSGKKHRMPLKRCLEVSQEAARKAYKNPKTLSSYFCLKPSITPGYQAPAQVYP